MIHIYRLEQTNAATFGALMVGGRMLGFTLELPWRENRRFESCIPPGVYAVRHREAWRRSRDHGPTYEVRDVPGRAGILFHPGNTIDDIEGCIAPGLAIGTVGGRRGVLHSCEAFKRFCGALEGISETLMQVLRIEGGIHHQ